MNEEDVRTEEFRIDGDRLLGKVRELIRKGNVRRIVIKSADGRPLIDIPLTWGVVGTALAPQLAAVGAVAALVGRATIVVERVAGAEEEEGEAEAPPEAEVD